MLAALSGSSIATISKLETGQRNASSRTLAGVADALGVEVADLFPKRQLTP